MPKITCEIQSHYGDIGWDDPEYEDLAQEMEACCPIENVEETGVTDCEQCDYFNPEGWPDLKGGIEVASCQ